MQDANYACRTSAHRLSRRAFLGSTALGAAGAFGTAGAAADLAKSQRRFQKGVGS